MEERRAPPAGRLTSDMLIGIQGSGQLDENQPDPGRYGMLFELHHVEHLCVVGTPEECAAPLGAYRDAGAEHISFSPAVGEAGFFEHVHRIRAVVDAGVTA